MNYELFIARRYLFSKKKTNVINLISAISVVGVAVATMALIVTLSVFNGFHDMVESFFTNFDAEIQITPAKGKTASADDPPLCKVREMEEVEVASDCIEDQALLMYHGRQAMVTIKGVDDNYEKMANIRQILYGDGTFELHAANLSYGILGIRIAEMFGTGYRFYEPIQVYAPRREGQLDMSNPESGFIQDELYSPGVIFSVMQSKYDSHYVLTPLAFARNIFEQEGMVSAVELKLKSNANTSRTKAKIKQIVGDEYVVKDRYEQQEDTFRIMEIEKFIAYIFLTFILIVACFNIVSSLSMLIIDKKDDVSTLRFLGATNKQITRIFVGEGTMISALGALIGLAVGLLLCFLQMKYGIIALGKSAGSFVTDAYPVSVHLQDVVVVFITVVVVGFLSAWYPVRHFANRMLSDGKKTDKQQTHTQPSDSDDIDS